MPKLKKRVILVLFLFLISLALMTYQYSRKPQSSWFDFMAAPYYLLNKTRTAIVNTIATYWNTFDENARMRKQLTALMVERQRFNEVIQENARLKELLALKTHEPKYIATATVVARGYDRFLRTFIIDKGARHGIQKDMAVITTRGLLGKIHSVKESSSQVLLMKDTNFSVSIRFQKGRQEAILSGTGYSSCTVKYVPPEERIEKGDVVVTSGLDGIFPPGIPVGVVSKVSKERAGFFQNIEVIPFQPDTKTEEVIVVRPGSEEGGFWNSAFTQPAQTEETRRSE